MDFGIQYFRMFYGRKLEYKCAHYTALRNERVPSDVSENRSKTICKAPQYKITIQRTSVMIWLAIATRRFLHTEPDIWTQNMYKPTKWLQFIRKNRIQEAACSHTGRLSKPNDIIIYKEINKLHIVSHKYNTILQTRSYTFIPLLISLRATNIVHMYWNHLSKPETIEKLRKMV